MPATKHKSSRPARSQPRAAVGFNQLGLADPVEPDLPPSPPRPLPPGGASSMPWRRGIEPEPTELGQGAGDFGPINSVVKRPPAGKLFRLAVRRRAAQRDRGRRGAGMRTRPGTPRAQDRRTDNSKSNDTSGKVIHN